MSNKGVYQMMDELHDMLISYYGGEFNYLSAKMTTALSDCKQAIGESIIATSLLVDSFEMWDRAVRGES